MRVLKPLLLATLLTALPLAAQELSLGVGPLRGQRLEGSTYAWQIAYAQRIARRTALSFAWYNEGHPRDHHRDGPALSLLRTWPWSNTGVLAASLGVYRTFDTVQTRDAYVNQHGLKGLVTLVAQRPLGDGLWRAHVEAAHTFGGQGFNSRSLMAGVALSLRTADKDADFPPVDRTDEHQVLSVSMGKAILNSFSSEQHAAYAIEYRHTLRPWLDWSVTYADEGDLERVDRDGLALQLWLMRNHLGTRLQVGVGLGPALLRTQVPEQSGNHFKMAARGTLHLGWRFPHSPWQLRAQWIRTRTRDHKDSDLLLGGVGYAF